jgi:hypothetical protein
MPFSHDTAPRFLENADKDLPVDASSLEEENEIYGMIRMVLLQKCIFAQMSEKSVLSIQTATYQEKAVIHFLQQNPKGNSCISLYGNHRGIML